ncbi:glycosyltransferase [Hydrogenophaga sp.]|uniref:glycosyltransferase family 2 protein n=1 Tax=Hydrogenophaga sp. TaxID=1904254 RepID=UPI0026214455|nr:glycosyltransferase [Hydrogenophaga sp.]MDM7950754.1 glycosyltransferase [Hydrogenophaga sp.]
MPEPILVSLIVCSYKQEGYIEEAVLSALAQTYDPLEIIISDDCSPDRTFEIIQKTLFTHAGKRNITAYQNRTNLGLVGNLNTAFALAQGELILVQGGDDCSLPDRTSELVAAYQSQQPKPDLVFSNVHFIDNKGKLLKTQTEHRSIPTLEQVIRGRFFIAGGMAAAYSRDMLEFFGPLDRLILYEDYVLTFRALARNGIKHVPKPLVKYRIHDESIMAHENAIAQDREKPTKILARSLAQEDDRYSTWRKSGRTYIFDGWRLKRYRTYLVADARSSTASRPQAMLWLLWAILTMRPFFARTIWSRDILRFQNSDSYTGA